MKMQHEIMIIFYCVSCAYKSYLKFFDFQSLRIISILIYTFIYFIIFFCFNQRIVKLTKPSPASPNVKRKNLRPVLHRRRQVCYNLIL